MLIHEALKHCGLTKKAVAYYEAQGLVQPTILDNGYRDFSPADVAAMKEIALLRKLGVGIQDIRRILASEDKRAVLGDCMHQLAYRIDTLSAQTRCMEHLLESGYDVEGTLAYATRHLDEGTAIREKLSESFPGAYGGFLALHFGRFLNERIDSAEKAAAYRKIIAFLDGLAEIPMPDTLKAYLAQASAIWEKEGMAQGIDDQMHAAVEDPAGFLEENRETIEQYLAYRKTDAYKASPAYQMQKLLLSFQQANGYYDVFIPNMKVLSRDYAAYQEALDEANHHILQRYPEAGDASLA